MVEEDDLEVVGGFGVGGAGADEEVACGFWIEVSLGG